MKNKMTRRQLAGAILTATGAAAGAQAPSSTPATEPEAARDRNQRIAEALAKVQVPMETEPAFHFTP